MFLIRSVLHYNPPSLYCLYCQTAWCINITCKPVISHEMWMSCPTECKFSVHRNTLKCAQINIWCFLPTWLPSLCFICKIPVLLSICLSKVGPLLLFICLSGGGSPPCSFVYLSVKGMSPPYNFIYLSFKGRSLSHHFEYLSIKGRPRPCLFLYLSLRGKLPVPSLFFSPMPRIGPLLVLLSIYLPRVCPFGIFL